MTATGRTAGSFGLNAGAFFVRTIWYLPRVWDELLRARARPNGFCTCRLHRPGREEASFRWRRAASCSSTSMRLRS